MNNDPTKNKEQINDADNPWIISAEDLPRQHVDLQTPEYTEKFRNAEIFAKKTKVDAVQVTAEGLASGQYENRDVHLDDKGNYVIDTYIMKEQSDGKRQKTYETTRELTPGDWILTNPLQQKNDYPNNYSIQDEIFQKRYERTDQPGVYRASGMARIIKNDVGAPVEIDAPWGGTQEGTGECYFAVTYDPNKPNEISSDRYLLSQNDRATYGTLAEVFGSPE